MTSPPKISIVTPSYNQGRFLEKTILSVLEQGYPNLEYIIIDGGSSDESVEIIKKYADRLTYWVSEQDRGQSHAINKGFERATGEIFGWLNSDDWYHQGALQAVAEAFAANPEAGAVVGAGEMVDENDETIQHTEPYEVTLESLYSWHTHFFWQPSCFFSRDAWLTSGGLDEEIHYAMDLDLWYKIAAIYRFATTPALLSSSLKHDLAKTTAFDYLLAVDITFVTIRYGGGTTARKGLEHYLEGLHQLLDEHNLTMRQMEEMIRHRDEALATQKKMIEDRWDIMQQMDEVIRQKDEVISQRDKIINNQQRLLNKTLLYQLVKLKVKLFNRQKP